jgi:ribosome-binding factor A
MQWNRTDRLAESLRQELNEILEYETDDVRLQVLTVSHVKLSHDMRNATVYVDIVDTSNIRVTLQALRQATPFIRYQLANRMQLKRVPDLVFQDDDTNRRARRIEELLSEEKTAESET